MHTECAKTLGQSSVALTLPDHRMKKKVHDSTETSFLGASTCINLANREIHEGGGGGGRSRRRRRRKTAIGRRGEEHIHIYHVGLEKGTKYVHWVCFPWSPLLSGVLDNPCSRADPDDLLRTFVLMFTGLHVWKNAWRCLWEMGGCSFFFFFFFFVPSFYTAFCVV
jgi:hypothetical protein